MSADSDGLKSRASDVAAALSQAEAKEVDIEFLRRVYASNREWYTVAETKAQLLLAANGVFVAILFGAVFGKAGDIRAGAGRFGLDTWIFIGVSLVALVGAIACAALCLWSLHGTANAEFARLDVDPDDPDSYKPEVLWYFGHLAHLRLEAAVEILRRADRTFEIDALSYHVIELAHRVLRKYRWVNAGWALTALALIALAAAGASYFVRA